MSKLQHAPGELEHVRAFVNTADLEGGIEKLSGPRQLLDWLKERALIEPGARVTRPEFERAIALREALRSVLLSHNSGTGPPREAFEALDAVAQRARIRLRFGADGESALLPETVGMNGALGRLLWIIHGAKADGSWQRLKACRDPECEWAFYDHTKNRSGAWCNMAICGNRAKARSYRERRGSH